MIAGHRRASRYRFVYIIIIFNIMASIEEIDRNMFVNSITRHSAIWDITSEEFRNRKKKKAAWEEIEKKLSKTLRKRLK